MIGNKLNSEILKALNQLAYKHEETKKQMINVINRSQVRYTQYFDDCADEDDLIPLHRALIVGESGTGKTHIINSLQKLVNFPLYYIDATRITHVSASGGIKMEELIRKIEKYCSKFCAENQYDYPTLQSAMAKCVVFIDEIDKISVKTDGSSNDWNHGTQSSLLTLLDGAEEYKEISFIFAGAFTGMKRTNAAVNALGFGATGTAASEVFLEEELVKFGILPEIVGRMTLISELDKFEKEDYRHILDTILIPKKNAELAYLGIFLGGLEEEFKDKICHDAVKSGQGVRYLHREINRWVAKKEFYYEEGEHDVE
jgi:ATP-dependent Clp protease ATP-binding subunit ClpX